MSRSSGRPPAGDRLISMTPTCVTTTSATTTRSLLPTRPETGRGQASLWTAAAAPDHRLWTTLEGSGGPLQVAHLPPPTTTGASSNHASITSIKGETTYAKRQVAESALANIDRP